MMSLKKLLRLLFVIIAIISLLKSEELLAQDIANETVKRNQLTAGIGFLGLLYLDEFRQETLYNRKSLPPLFIQYDRQLWNRLSLGVYIGLEYEIQSGTVKDFDGPTTSLVSGFLTDFHLIKIERRNFIDPYLGLSFFYYNSSGIEKTVLPGFRLGCNLKLYNALQLRMNIGTGAAIIETGLVFNY